MKLAKRYGYRCLHKMACVKLKDSPGLFGKVVLAMRSGNILHGCILSRERRLGSQNRCALGLREVAYSLKDITLS